MGARGAEVDSAGLLVRVPPEHGVWKGYPVEEYIEWLSGEHTREHLSFEELGQVLGDRETPEWIKGVLRDPELLREILRIDEGLSQTGRVLSRIMGAVQIGVAREAAGAMQRLRYASLLAETTPAGSA